MKNDSPVHFTAQARPNITPATSRQGRGPSVGTPRDRSAPSAIRPAEPGPHLVPVDHQGAERGDHEGLQEDVEDRRAGQHERHALHRHQQRRR